MTDAELEFSRTASTCIELSTVLLQIQRLCSKNVIPVENQDAFGKMAKEMRLLLSQPLTDLATRLHIIEQWTTVIDQTKEENK